MISIFRSSAAAQASRAPAQDGGAARAVRAALGFLPVQAALFALAYFAFARAGLMFAELDQADRERLQVDETRFVTKGRITPAEFEQRVIGLLETVTNDRKVSHHGP